MFLQQHELDALGQVVPGISRQQVKHGCPTWGNLQANARGCDAGGCHLRGSEAQEGMIWDENKSIQVDEMVNFKYFYATVILKPIHISNKYSSQPRTEFTLQGNLQEVVRVFVHEGFGLGQRG